MNEKLYEELLERMGTAHVQEFFLESSWIAYTILEDRLVSVLADSGGSRYKNHKPIIMLGKKLAEIEKRSVDDTVLLRHFPHTLLSRIHAWKEERNSLVHTVEHGEATLSTLTNSAKRLSTTAKPLVRDVTKAARGLNAQRSKGAASQETPDN